MGKQWKHWKTEKDVLFIIGDWNAKVGSQEIPGVTGKFGLEVQNETWQKLTTFCQENALVVANTLFQQHKRRLYTWTSPDGQYWNRTDYILCSQRWRSSIQSAKTRLGADCGSDHELLIANFRLKLKKVGKTPRPFSSVQFSSVQSLSRVWLFATPWTTARQASPSITNSRSLRPSSQWCHQAISSSVVPFFSCPQSLPASESFPMSQLFTWGGQSY